MNKYGKIGLLLAGLSSSVAYSQGFDDVTITDTQLRGSVFMLQGAGGNIGLSVGEDGLLMIDDQFAPLGPKIKAALDTFGQGQPQYIINTHYHGDHTGSNAFFHEQHGATIFAHHNVRIRLLNDDKRSEGALPVVTYGEGIQFHFNGETIHVKHLPMGHTDGDSVIWFEQPNVLHTGDLFFNGMFPYIDLGAGGDVKGYMDSVTEILKMINDDTMIIPGHGPIATKKEYQSFLAMIEQTHDFVQTQKAKGMTVEQVVDTGLPTFWKPWAWQFISEERWIKTLY